MEPAFMPQRFTNLPLNEKMLSNLEQLGYHQMTPVQEKSLPLLLQGEDLIAQAKTGSGKTAAFGIALLHHLDLSRLKVQAAVICPTRELSEQVANELRRLARFQDNIKILTLVGGEAVYPQKVALEKGVHIIVGTPGRIMDTITKGHLHLEEVKTLVLDEADRMLDMGFHDDIAAIIKYMPEERQTLLFSATFEKETQALSKKFQKKAQLVTIVSQQSEATIIQHFYQAEEAQKIDLIEALITSNKISSCIVFCNMKLTCDDVSEALRIRGFDAAALHGDMEQKDRNEILTMFTNQSLSILVATDVAARGLDIKDLPAIINYDITSHPEVHLHRIGRTGRMRKEGLAFTFVGAKELKFFKAIEAYAKESYTLESPKELRADKHFDKTAPMRTLKILGGKKEKLRAGDFVGALSGELGYSSEDVGKITVLDRMSYIAVKKELFYKIHLKDDRLKVKKSKYRYIKL
jgi:ATP-independent RNA helicase DbpA